MLPHVAMTGFEPVTSGYPRSSTVRTAIEEHRPARYLAAPPSPYTAGRGTWSRTRDTRVMGPLRYRLRHPAMGPLETA